jgi:hypothetical protein
MPPTSSASSMAYQALLLTLLSTKIRIRDEHSGSGMNIPDHISESVDKIFVLKIRVPELIFFDAMRVRDPQSF